MQVQYRPPQSSCCSCYMLSLLNGNFLSFQKLFRKEEIAIFCCVMAKFYRNNSRVVLYQLCEYCLIDGFNIGCHGKFFFCLFGLRLYIPVNNFSVMSGRSHSFLGITSTFWEVNVSCSMIQHGDLCEDRTPDLSLWSLMLYHQASLVMERI